MGEYNINDLIKATKNGKPEDLFSMLSSEDAARIKNVLADKALTEKILQSEQARQLIKTFMKDGKQNG
jgi:hypothetical protein